MVAPKVCTGFEFGTTAGFATGQAGNRLFDIGASPTITSTGAVRTGTYCLELSPTAGLEWVGWSSGGGFPASQNRLVLGMAVRFPTSLPGANCNLAVLDQGGSFGVLQFNSGDSTLRVTIGGGTQQTGPTVSADTWYYVELYANISANPWTLDWWVDGSAQTQATGAQAAGTFTRVVLGDDSSQTMVCRYDDLVLWTDTADLAAPFGAHKVVGLIPDTGGTTAEIGTANATGRMVTNSAIDATHNSANILAALSEIPPTLGATASGIGQRTSGTGNACGIPFTTYTLAAGESFSGLRIVECGWASGTAANQQGLRTFNGTTEDILFAAGDINADTSSTAPAWLCKMAVDGRFDTQGEVDALVVRWGYSGDIAPLPGAHAIYAEAAVKEASGVTGTVAETQDNQTSTASGWIEVTGTVAETQDAQTSTASGTVTGPVTGTVAETQDNQTAAAAGVLGYTGTSARTQADQISTATGILGYSGTSARTQADQTSTASGVLGYSGTIAETQNDQTSSASGSVGGAGEVSGTLAETQDPQTSSAVGQLGYSGTSASTQANQIAAGSGWITIAGSVAEIQDPQTATASGVLASTGIGSLVQANQTATAAGWITVTGLVAETQANQTAAATGFFGDIPIPSGVPLQVTGTNFALTASSSRLTTGGRPHDVTVPAGNHVVEAQ